MKTKYISLDNESFSTENECLEHEKELIETPIKDLVKSCRYRRQIEDMISNYVKEDKHLADYDIYFEIHKDDDKRYFLRIRIITPNNSNKDFEDLPDDKFDVYSVATKFHLLDDSVSIKDIPNLVREQLYDSLSVIVDNARNEYSNTGNISDGYHTFNQLYYQRCVLFSVIVNSHPDISWKSRRHSDGELCFNGDYFIVGIDTPEGSFTYHYENKYWDMFKCVELNKGRKWDGHTEEDITRLFSIK